MASNDLRIDHGQDLVLVPGRAAALRWLLIGALFVALPWLIDEYFLSPFTFICIYAIAGLGMMVLLGYTGLVSFGQAAFLAIGAYTAGALETAGVPFVVALPAAGLVAAGAGVMIGLPALRMTGLFLAIATLSFAFIVEEVITRWTSVTRGSLGLIMPDATLFGWAIDSERKFYLLCLGILVLCLLGVANLLRSPIGRAFIAIRDSRIAAQSMGVNLAIYQTLSFAIGAALTGFAGALLAHKLTFITPEQFGINVSIEMLTLVVVGGLGSLHGVVFGAAFIILLPQVIAGLRGLLPDAIANQTGIETAAFGIILILFIIVEPGGIYGRWQSLRRYWSEFPFCKAGSFKRQRSFLKSERW